MVAVLISDVCVGAGFPDAENVSLPGSSPHMRGILLFSLSLYIYIYEKEMATHSRILAWKIP